MSSIKTVFPKMFLPKGTPERVIIGAVKETAEEAARLYNSTTGTWTKRPKFTVRAIKRRNAIAFQTSTESDVYLWVDYGTRARQIRARGVVNGGADSLAFRTGFKAKTKPRTFGSFNGASFGELTRPVVVNYPGIKARDFTKDIADLSQKDLAITMQRSINAWLRTNNR